MRSKVLTPAPLSEVEGRLICDDSERIAQPSEVFADATRQNRVPRWLPMEAAKVSLGEAVLRLAGMGGFCDRA